MFNSYHYVPILKWKGAERLALEKLTVHERGYITPLIQFVMPTPKLKDGKRYKTPSELLEESISLFENKLPEVPSEIEKYWGKSPAFVDFSLIHTSLRKEGFSAILNSGRKLGLFLIPAIRLNSDRIIKEMAVSLAKKNKSGLCLRLFRSDFSDKTPLDKKTDSFLRENGFSAEEVDIIIDFQITDDRCLKLKDLSSQIPNLNKWRSFVFASGSFPVDLSQCELGENYIIRSDWNNWFSQVNSGVLLRIPSFSDYVIQHPIYKESTRFFPPSASIRYTLPEEWLIMRGQKNKHVQYLANAQLLSNHPKFFGSDFSYGDAYIAEKGKSLKGKPGNATNWLTAGINHHLVCTVSQLANLTLHKGIR